MKTKNNEKNSFRKTMSYLFFFTILTFSSCNKEENPTDCGCNSSITTIVSELEGTITYKEQTQSNNYYTNKYWVTYTDSNCSNCVLHMIVCNDDFVNNNITNLLNTQEKASIKFTGELR
ncbi:hypothetical protein N9752_04070, partial [Polaribacter sp.]|nr:hypothetical protein [Polaribacter sp.]